MSLENKLNTPENTHRLCDHPWTQSIKFNNLIIIYASISFQIIIYSPLKDWEKFIINLFHFPCQIDTRITENALQKTTEENHLPKLPNSPLKTPLTIMLEKLFWKEWADVQ